MGRPKNSKNKSKRVDDSLNKELKKIKNWQDFGKSLTSGYFFKRLIKAFDNLKDDRDYIRFIDRYTEYFEGKKQKQDPNINHNVSLINITVDKAYIDKTSVSKPLKSKVDTKPLEKDKKALEDDTTLQDSDSIIDVEIEKEDTKENE